MTRTAREKVQKAQKQKTGTPVAFKYYIHDTTKGYSLEMSGPFTESSVSELSCCWETAKPTLKDRTLTLDLRGLTSVDESAKRWLASMNQEGAQCVPPSFMLDTLAGQPGREEPETTKQTFIGRVANALRGVA